MALPLLGIAQGAAAIGQRIFEGIKNRQERRQEKRAAKQAARNARLMEAQQRIFSGGVIQPQTTVATPDNPISQAAGNFGSVLFGGIGGGAPVTTVEDRDTIRMQQAGMGFGMDPKQITIIVMIIGAFFLFRKKLFK